MPKSFVKNLRIKTAMDNYKDSYFGANNAAADEYDPNKRVYKEDRPSNYSADSKKHAETDHIEPIKKITTELRVIMACHSKI